jgi:zinc transporter ZupT
MAQLRSRGAATAPELASSLCFKNMTGDTMWPTLLIILYCVLIAAASLLGGMLPALLRLSHTRMQVIMSFVGGLVLGVAVLHLLPHSAVESWQRWAAC